MLFVQHQQVQCCEPGVQRQKELSVLRRRPQSLQSDLLLLPAHNTLKQGAASKQLRELQMHQTGGPQVYVVDGAGQQRSTSRNETQGQTNEAPLTAYLSGSAPLRSAGAAQFALLAARNISERAGAAVPAGIPRSFGHVLLLPMLIKLQGR